MQKANCICAIDIRHCLVEHYQGKHLEAVRLQLSCIPFCYLYYIYCQTRLPKALPGSSSIVM